MFTIYINIGLRYINIIPLVAFIGPIYLSRIRYSDYTSFWQSIFPPFLQVILAFVLYTFCLCANNMTQYYNFHKMFECFFFFLVYGSKSIPLLNISIRCGSQGCGALKYLE